MASVCSASSPLSRNRKSGKIARHIFPAFDYSDILLTFSWELPGCQLRLKSEWLESGCHLPIPESSRAGDNVLFYQICHPRSNRDLHSGPFSWRPLTRGFPLVSAEAEVVAGSTQELLALVLFPKERTSSPPPMLITAAPDGAAGMMPVQLHSLS